MLAGVLPAISESTDNIDANREDKEADIDASNLCYNDERLDQYQNNDCGYWRRVYKNYQLAQNFTPSFETLTKVILKIGKNGNPPDDTIITVSIRKSRYEDDLTSTYVTGADITSSKIWIPFNFEDIPVTPYEDYFIILKVSEGDQDNRFGWYFDIYNPYKNGNAWETDDGGKNWQVLETPERPERDFCFKTYGIDSPPNPPILTGPPSGITGQEYSYTLQTSDPEKHNISYTVIWGDGSSEDWLGPYVSGTEITVSHTWNEQGSFTIQAKAKDNYDVESDWTTLEVTMPKNKAYSSLYRLLENHPLVLKLFQRVFTD